MNGSCRQARFAPRTPCIACGRSRPPSSHATAYVACTWGWGRPCFRCVRGLLSPAGNSIESIRSIPTPLVTAVAEGVRSRHQHDSNPQHRTSPIVCALSFTEHYTAPRARRVGVWRQTDASGVCVLFGRSLRYTLRVVCCRCCRPPPWATFHTRPPSTCWSSTLCTVPRRRLCRSGAVAPPWPSPWLSVVHSLLGRPLIQCRAVARVGFSVAVDSIDTLGLCWAAE